jgi:hypothetical protein
MVVGLKGFRCFHCKHHAGKVITVMCIDTYKDLKLSVSTTEREPERVPETTQQPNHNHNNNIDNMICQISEGIHS